MMDHHHHHHHHSLRSKRRNPHHNNKNNNVLVLIVFVLTILSTTTTTISNSNNKFKNLFVSGFSSRVLSRKQTQQQKATTTTTTTFHKQFASSLVTSTSIFSTTSSTSSSSTSSTSSSSASASWFPRRIQEDVDYKNIVQSLYLRHILVETYEAAQLVMESYLHPQFLKYADPFGQVALRFSACSTSRNEGGMIGWINVKDILELQQENEVTSSTPSPSSLHMLIPNDVLIELVEEKSPKAGDVHIIQSQQTKQYHIVRTEEILIQPNPKININMNKERRVGTHAGTNAILPRRKLKGAGIMPQLPQMFPTTTSVTSTGTTDTTTQEDKAEGTTTISSSQSSSSSLSYFIQTNGCQMNVADSERLAGILEHDLQYQKASTGMDANIVLFNTCSIRDHAEQKLYDILGPYCIKKRQGEQVAIIVTGCVAQQEGEELLRRIPEIDVVLGPQYVPFLRNILESIEWGHQLVVTAPMLHQEDSTIITKSTSSTTSSVVNNNNNNYNNNPNLNSVNDFLSTKKPVRGHNVRAWVNIINGCNEHCTYCVVPATRGMEQSRSMEAILQECQNLVKEGYKEITLLGQNIDAYGRDMVPKRTFAELLEYLNYNLLSFLNNNNDDNSNNNSNNNNKLRIRYVTSHPRYFSDRVIDAVANLELVCECFHMPFQAGDDDVLKRMRRGYTYDSYMKIIDKIRTKSPNASICGDVIAGFPGETEEAFQKTLQLMEAVKFDNLNTFAYSPRPNTEAALMTNQIPETVKKERLLRVQDLAAKHGLERSQNRYLNEPFVEVLVEDCNPKNPKTQVMGRTRQGRQVYFDGNIHELQGQFVHVKITEARTWSLMGEMVQ